MLDIGMSEGQKKKKKKKAKCHFFFSSDLISARRRTSSTKQYSENCLMNITHVIAYPQKEGYSHQAGAEGVAF